MRKIKYLPVIMVLLFFISCSDKKKDSSRIDTMDTQSNETDSANQSAAKLEKEKRWKEIEEERKMDSIKLEMILEAAIRKITPSLQKDQYAIKYNIFHDSLYNVEIEMELGFFLSKKDKHLIIRRKDPTTTYIHVYAVRRSELSQIIRQELMYRTYVSDTIQDINGDQLKDFVINWYGSIGCCLKAFSNVYLQRANGSFTSGYEFINPTFSPQEHLIRGVRYGHPGDTEMYKYRWNGENVDTVEYLYLQKTDDFKKTGKFVRSSQLSYSSEVQAKYQVIDEVPKEYTKIFGFDWFMGNM
jgi:hypothetical protein